MCKSADVIVLQETWLLPHDFGFIGTIDQGFEFISKLAVDILTGPFRGRLHREVAIMWKKGVFSSVVVVLCETARISAVKVAERCFLVLSVHIPNDNGHNLTEFVEVLSEINTVIESSETKAAVTLGDFNAHPVKLFYKELINFCDERK